MFLLFFFNGQFVCREAYSRTGRALKICSRSEMVFSIEKLDHTKKTWAFLEIFGNAFLILIRLQLFIAEMWVIFLSHLHLFYVRNLQQTHDVLTPTGEWQSSELCELLRLSKQPYWQPYRCSKQQIYSKKQCCCWTLSWECLKNTPNFDPGENEPHCLVANVWHVFKVWSCSQKNASSCVSLCFVESNCLTLNVFGRQACKDDLVFLERIQD